MRLSVSKCLPPRQGSPARSQSGWQANRQGRLGRLGRLGQLGRRGWLGWLGWLGLLGLLSRLGRLGWLGLLGGRQAGRLTAIQPGFLAYWPSGGLVNRLAAWLAWLPTYAGCVLLPPCPPGDVQVVLFEVLRYLYCGAVQPEAG